MKGGKEMNIKKAKIHIENTITSYLTKDDLGQYIIPIQRQRPIILMGPPGIGKTDIMEQIAQEKGIGLVAYSMTHHTRQSALGLPSITTEEFEGKEYLVSRYTMSEIIATVYDVIKKTGKKEGILFLDEVNCVSETLSPSMLQFLQYKKFGEHTLPEGWIVVTAGNPPEYNNSVHEFDTVTWDRLKRIDVSEDFGVWKEYAVRRGVHPSIISFLEYETDKFYKIQKTVDGTEFVTARGWVDLSDIIYLYERHRETDDSFVVDEDLISQYLQSRSVAREFASYYELFNKYKATYQLQEILNGDKNEEIVHRAKEAKAFERYSIISLIVSILCTNMKELYSIREALLSVKACLQKLRKLSATGNVDISAELEARAREFEEKIANSKTAGSLSRDDERIYRNTIDVLHKLSELAIISKGRNCVEVLQDVIDEFKRRGNNVNKDAAKYAKQLDNAFAFIDNAFTAKSPECTNFVTEITINKFSSTFISTYSELCASYFAHNDVLMVSRTHGELMKRINKINEDFDME